MAPPVRYDARPSRRDSDVGGRPYTVLRDAILAHGTMAEGLTTRLSSIPALR